MKIMKRIEVLTGICNTHWTSSHHQSPGRYQLDEFAICVGRFRISPVPWMLLRIQHMFLNCQWIYFKSKLEFNKSTQWQE